MDSPQASVRQRASRVLQLLGVSHSATVTRSTTPAPPTPAASASAPDLLGGLDDAPASATPAPQINGGGGGDFLGGHFLQTQELPRKGPHKQSGRAFCAIQEHLLADSLAGK